MGIDVYQVMCGQFAEYPKGIEVLYPMIGLANESGEALGKIKKVLRGDKTLEQQTPAIADELGDVLWYLAMTAKGLGYSLEEVAQLNYDKLSRRQLNGTIKGDGDTR